MASHLAIKTPVTKKEVSEWQTVFKRVYSAPRFKKYIIVAQITKIKTVDHWERIMQLSLFVRLY